MTKSRLTRQELSWLLTQEAQHAAERLRMGVQVLRTQTPPPSVPHPTVKGAVVATPPHHDPDLHVDASLDALDDVMRMLSNLNQRAATAPTPRRGRIDIAALLFEIAPEARVQIEPGSGTEVFGEEADLRRMVQVLVGHGSGLGSNVIVRREGDEVRVSVSLGPDASPTAETERVWLSRMALRYGGRHELEGGSEVLVFPAEEAAEASEREKLRRELDEARRQREAYARELAAIFERGEDVAGISTVPPPPVASGEERVALAVALARGVARELEGAIGPLAQALAGARQADLDDTRLEALRERATKAEAIVKRLATFGAVDPAGLGTVVSLDALAAEIVHDVASRVSTEIALVHREASAQARAPSRAAGAVLRGLLEQALAASPPGAKVSVRVARAEGGGACWIVDDAGPPVVATARRALLALETERPGALALFLAAELAAGIGARLELGDAPGGGVRVTVAFAAV